MVGPRLAGREWSPMGGRQGRLGASRPDGVRVDRNVLAGGRSQGAKTPSTSSPRRAGV